MNEGQNGIFSGLANSDASNQSNFGLQTNNSTNPQSGFASQANNGANTQPNFSSQPNSGVVSQPNFAPQTPVVGPSGGDIILGGKDSQKSHKWLIFLILGIVLAAVVAIIAIIFVTRSIDKDTDNVQMSETAATYEFIDENDEEVLQFLTIINAVYNGEASAEMFKVSATDAETTETRLKSGLERLKNISEELNNTQELENEEIKEASENLRKALEQDLPKLEQLVKLIGEIFDGFLNGEDIVGLNNGDGAAVGAIMREKVPNLKTGGEGSIADYWVKLWDIVRTKMQNTESQNEE